MLMTLEDGKNIATIIGVIVALVVYITNSIQQRRQQRIENAMRFISAHEHLFENKVPPRKLASLREGHI